MPPTDSHSPSILPDFFVLGAQKAGTTSLHHWLARQAVLSLPLSKETHFFSHDERYDKSLDWYLDQFPPPRQGCLRGEVDPEYIFRPQAAERMARLGLRPRCVVVVRAPLERAYSHYRMSVLQGVEPLSFPAALQAEASRLATGAALSVEHHSYLTRGRYADQVARFRAQLPEAQLLVVGFEELFSSATGGATFERICRFIGLEGPLVLPDYSRAFNPARAARWQFLNGLIWDRSRLMALRKLFRMAVPFRSVRAAMGRNLYALNQRTVDQPADWLRGVEERFLRQADDEARRTAEALGVNTDNWLRGCDARG